MVGVFLSACGVVLDEVEAQLTMLTSSTSVANDNRDSHSKTLRNDIVYNHVGTYAGPHVPIPDRPESYPTSPDGNVG